MKARTHLTQSEFDELVRPKLKLFLSVDIVGSTHYKQRDKDAYTQSWLPLFVSFFADFPEFLNGQVDQQKSAQNHGDLAYPKLWKSLGDELIFTVELCHRTHAAAYLRAFTYALRTATANWHMDAKTPALKELHLKGAAWLAGFPVGNAEIPIEMNVDEKKMDGRDYIGPMIDIGFRVKEHASVRKLVVSAELAYILLSAEHTGMDFFYDGEVALKGVLKGKPYPIVWLECEPRADDMHHKAFAHINDLRDKLTGRSAVKDSNLKDYLKLWLEETKPCLAVPFIKDDEFGDLKADPGYEKQLSETIESLIAVFTVFEDKGDENTQGKAQMPQGAVDLLNDLHSLFSHQSIRVAPQKTSRDSGKAKAKPKKKKVSQSSRKKRNP